MRKGILKKDKIRSILQRWLSGGSPLTAEKTHRTHGTPAGGDGDSDGDIFFSFLAPIEARIVIQRPYGGWITKKVMDGWIRLV